MLPRLKVWKLHIELWQELWTSADHITTTVSKGSYTELISGIDAIVMVWDVDDQDEGCKR